MIEYLIAMCIPLALVTAWGTVMFCRIWWGHNPTYGVPARIHLNGWPRLLRWLTDGPLRDIETITIAREPRHDRLFRMVLNTPTSGWCEACNAVPGEHCDAGLYS